MKIPILNDNQDLAFLIRWMLEDEGYELKSAKNGSDGYFIYLLFNHDLVLTDIQMPEKNGLEMIKQNEDHVCLHRYKQCSGGYGAVTTLV